MRRRSTKAPRIALAAPFGQGFSTFFSETSRRTNRLPEGAATMSTCRPTRPGFCLSEVCTAGSLTAVLEANMAAVAASKRAPCPAS